MPDLKLYVLVRRDLPWSVRAVQSIHAALTLYENNSISASLPVVLIGVENEDQLTELLYDKFENVAVGFREPDLDDQLTAIAFVSSPLPEFANLRLL